MQTEASINLNTGEGVGGTEEAKNVRTRGGGRDLELWGGAVLVKKIRRGGVIRFSKRENS